MSQKTIYMTYMKMPPQKVFQRWLKLNMDYQIDFSLDSHCISFLKENFNDYVVDLFNRIPKGMYKADLWRLCKLYINGGVYADVDLVPHLELDKLDKDVTFYSCLSINYASIFQAFMMAKSKSPLILHFLISFLLNNPWHDPDGTNDYGPTLDMFECIKYNLNGIQPVPETKYIMNSIKIPVLVGESDTNIKKIDLHYFPENLDYNIRLADNPHNDCFFFKIEDNTLIVMRIDKNEGWGYPHKINICFNVKEKIYLFPEKHDGNWYESYILNNGVKILDSRDPDYMSEGNWDNRGW